MIGEKILDVLLIAWLALMQLTEWGHEASEAYPPVSWIIHGLFAIPLAFIDPWCPAAVFGYREAEQALHAHGLGDEPVTWLVAIDRFMDVAVPAVVGHWRG